MPKILTHVGFSDTTPVIDLQAEDTIIRHTLTKGPLTLHFDTSQRYCAGWHDLETGESHTCPDSVPIDSKYEQCSTCQRRTGFNPAFYHATTVSEQQERRNREPHFLYLAYFAPNLIKVGISYKGRGTARLLEQGARTAYVLETFPTALVARQYEAKISAMPGMHEHLTARKKRDVWSRPYDQRLAKAELDEMITRIATETGATFSGPTFFDLNPYYFFDTIPNLADIVDCSEKSMISGEVIGCLGTDLIVQNQERLLSLHLKNFIGYNTIFTSDIETITLPPVQASLF